MIQYFFKCATWQILRMFPHVTLGRFSISFCGLRPFLWIVRYASQSESFLKIFVQLRPWLKIKIHFCWWLYSRCRSIFREHFFTILIDCDRVYCTALSKEIGWIDNWISFILFSLVECFTILHSWSLTSQLSLMLIFGVVFLFIFFDFYSIFCIFEQASF